MVKVIVAETGEVVNLPTTAEEEVLLEQEQLSDEVISEQEQLTAEAVKEHEDEFTLDDVAYDDVEVDL